MLYFKINVPSRKGQNIDSNGLRYNNRLINKTVLHKI